jgi:hypothetical protein
MRDGSLEREDWLGLGIGFEGAEEGAEPVALAPMVSFTGGVMMRSASLRRDSEVEEEGEGEEEEGGGQAEARAGLAVAEAALREAAAESEGPGTSQTVRARTWDQFLESAGGERCTFTNLVWKRSGLLARRRQLVLTNRGRLLYIDPKALVVKGVIIAAEELQVKVRGEHAFDVVTPQRAHHFTDYEAGAERWAAAIRACTCPAAPAPPGGQGPLDGQEPPPPPLPGSWNGGSPARVLKAPPSSLSSSPSPSSSPVRMLPVALAMLGLGTGAAGGSPHAGTEKAT